MSETRPLPPGYPGIDDPLLALAIAATTLYLEGSPLTTAVVQRFGHMTASDRYKVANALSGISTILLQDIKFQPKLFDRHIKIRVRSNDQAHQLQQKLITWGCGFYVGSYPLKREIELGNVAITSVHVTPTGCIGLNFEEDGFTASSDHELQLEALLQAQTPADARKLIEP